MVVEELLQLLVAEVDAHLLETVVVEYLEAGDVEDSDERDPLHGSVHEGLVTPVHQVPEGLLEEGPEEEDSRERRGARSKEQGARSNE